MYTTLTPKYICEPLLLTSHLVLGQVNGAVASTAKLFLEEVFLFNISDKGFNK